jgi:hypothetical protein
MPLLVEQDRADELALQACFTLKAKRQGHDDPRKLRWRADPVAWVRERLGEFLWSKQIEIIESIRDHRRTAVPSAHETGKSFVASRAVCWWLDVHPPGEAFVVTTAPTGEQVRAILWREINRAHTKGHLPGRTNQTEWWLNDEMVAFGRKPADYNPSAFQGIHARYVLVVLDEACGVPETIYNAAASLAANERSRIIAIGNPDDPTSHFAKVCNPGSGWNVIHVDGLDTPNFSGEEIPDELRDLLISDVYVEEQRRDVGDPDLPYGQQTSPIFLSKVRGQFPELAEDVVIQLSFIRSCQEDRVLEPQHLLPVELGVDVGAGGDRTVIRERRGLQIGRVWRYSTPDPEQAAGYVVQAIRETGATRVKVDSIGIGWALAGWVRTLQTQAEIVSVNVSKSSIDPARYPKLRDQLWWQIGHDAMQRKLLDLRGLDDTTIAQLIAPKWKPDSLGRYDIEAKRDTRKRLGRSPDDADALLLSYFSPPRAQTGSAAGGERQSTAGYVPR